MEWGSQQTPQKYCRVVDSSYISFPLTYRWSLATDILSADPPVLQNPTLQGWFGDSAGLCELPGESVTFKCHVDLQELAGNAAFVEEDHHEHLPKFLKQSLSCFVFLLVFWVRRTRERFGSALFDVRNAKEVMSTGIRKLTIF